MTGDSSRAELEHNRRTFLSEQRQQVNLKLKYSFAKVLLYYFAF